ncbi:putative metal-binding motif-containing protein [Sorangium sp. So ce131]|uniref:putative metal-binding motif-containing protein n=1 Tax=Sorangium sp. So ce131 TaxID=3133282 RepID=UPI003F5E5BB6
MRTSSLFHPVPAVSLALLTLLAAPQAHARRSGVAAACIGCHTGGAAPGITIDVTPRNPAAGETATLQVTIDAVNGSVGGIYLTADGGQLAAIDGQGTHLVDGRQLLHSAPKRASGGVVRFEARWTAPATPGGVLIDVWGLSGNGDNGSRGDGAASAQLAFAYGCAGSTYYWDRDADGYGDPTATKVACAPPPDYTSQAGDCDDYSASVHPDHDELCNGRDDDCDGQADEDLEVSTQFEDADGDGHGDLFGATVTAKCPPEGFAPTADDCDDRSPDINPSATETCNLLDDDCDGWVDERVREVCGVGMCAREADTCAPGSCTPGEPAPEECNGLDDDCDGEVDEGTGPCDAPVVGCDGVGCGGGSAAGSGSSGAGAGPGGPGTPDDGGAPGGGCALSPAGASPWRLLALLSPLALVALRRLRRADQVRRRRR